ncbi:phage tail protein [Murdochiella sp. Marseille-P8839]|nr:phage tail protein [Murdochiella sp. Marseille-P8839]
MIILHDKNENDYKSNGLGLLDKNIIDPKVLWKLNGEYTFSFKYPLHATLGTEIKNGMQVEIVSDALSDVFRIQVTEQSMGYITAYCEQKSYDLIDNFIEDINIVNCTGVDAIKRIQNAMAYPHPFVLSSTITDVKNARMIRLGGMQALMDQRLANSFLSRWGGEIERSYNEVKIVPHIGQDFGVKIQYRKDLVGYKAKIDSSTVVTRIRPVGFNGLSLPEKYVDSVRIDPKHPKIKKIKYEKAKAALGQYKDDKDAVPESEALEMLRRFAAEDFRKGIDQPTATYDVDFVLLKNTEEYRDIANLQTIRGGDTITVEHALDGFFVSARCVQFEYNPLTGEYVSMRLGNIKESLSETLTTSRDLEALREEQQAIQHSYMDVVSKEIEKTWRNEDGYNYELKKENPFDLPAGYYSFNAPIDQNPTKVIGISAGSLVISNRRQSDGKWNFRTFGTGEGFTADLIRAGMLQGGAVKWNLETGYLNIGDKLIYDPETGELRFASGSITMGSLDSDTQEKIQGAYDSTKELERGYTEIKEGEARFVTKTALGTVGETSINGYNITTGAIRSQNGATNIDLNGANFNFGYGSMTYTPTDGLRIGGDRFYMTSDDKCFAIHSREWANGRLGGFRGTTNPSGQTSGVMLYASHGFNLAIGTQLDQGDSNYKQHIIFYHTSQGPWSEVREDMIVKAKLWAVTGAMIRATEMASSSDIRLKKDIKPWDVKALDALKNTDFIRYKWKNKRDDEEHYGVIAQSIPLAQSKGADGYLAVDGYTMECVTAKAVVELAEEVDAIRKENAELKQELKELKEAINDLIKRR